MQQRWTLVTGASGFIGGHLVKQLVERGEHVKAFVRPGSNLKYLSGLPADLFQLAYGDITISNTVYRALSSCDRLYHVASNYKMWDPDPDRILTPAVEGTRAVLEAAKQRDLEKIVVTSSVAALGVSDDGEPMDESHEFNLSDPETYILSKHRAEQVAQEYADEGQPIVIVNPSGVFGPQDWKPTPSGESILTYMKISPMIRIPVTSGGMNVVDVEDVARGHLLAMDKGNVGERYILGGDDVTFAEFFTLLSEITGLAPPGGEQSQGLVELIGRVMELKTRLFGGADPPVTYRMARDFAFQRVWVTSEKAEQELGYTHRPARETLTRSVRWFLANGYLPPKASARVRLELRHAT